MNRHNPEVADSFAYVAYGAGFARSGLDFGEVFQFSEIQNEPA